MSLAVRDVTKTIKGRQVLKTVSINAPDGCVIGLSGVNGSGKTMLMRIIGGFVRPDSGSVTIDGKTLWSDIEFPPSMGLLIENPAFLARRSGIENLELLASIKGIVGENRIRETLQFVGLDPEDRRHYSKYSLGMKQRLGLAAAIMEEPHLLLLDEPTNALDSSGIQMVERLVHEMRSRGSIVILACHDAQVLRGLSDRIYHLAEGHLDGQEVIRGKSQPPKGAI